MKKGFTLIEMLGIITVLALILLVTFPILTSSLKQTTESKENNYIKNLKPGAEAYIELNREKYPQLNIPGNEVTFKVQELYDSNLFKGQYEGIDPEANIIVESAQDGILKYYYDPSGETQTFSYTGREQRLKIERTGIYKLEVWGAQGGYGDENSRRGGYGGYSTGLIELKKGETLYINVGGQGANNITNGKIGQGGYNGGGSALSGDSYNHVGSGGGATHIALKPGILSSFDTNNDGAGSTEEISNILIVAGGGGGGYYHGYGPQGVGGDAGGYIGNSGTGNPSLGASGGTQTSGGIGQVNGSFGQGGSNTDSCGNGGGGGFYGGGNTRGGDQTQDYNFSGAGGGSGYIGNVKLKNAVMYCYGCDETGDEGVKTISTTGSYRDAVNCPNGYSSSALTNCAKADNGYAKITLVRIEM